MKTKSSKSKIKEQDQSAPYYKLILIGENEVGKTQLLHRLNNEPFNEKYSPTFGIDFRIKSIYEEKGKLKYDLQIIDIAGQSDAIHLEIEKEFLNDAHAFICLFDLSDQSSLERAIHIMEDYKNKIEQTKSKRWYLLGNKKDLDLKREGVPNYYKTKFANYFEVSSKDSKNEEFEKIIDTISYDLFLSKNEHNNEQSGKSEDFDFKKNHENLFDEECKII